MFNLQRWKRAHSLLLANQKGSKGQHISGQNILGQNISGQKQTIFKIGKNALLAVGRHWPEQGVVLHIIDVELINLLPAP